MSEAAPPPRASAHAAPGADGACGVQPPDLVTVWELCDRLQAARRGEPVQWATVVQVAADAGVPLAHVLVAGADDPTLRPADDANVRVVVCSGPRCQQRGSIAVLEAFARWRQQAGDAADFVVVAHNCLDRCDHGPSVSVCTPDGEARLTHATAATVAEVAAWLAAWRASACCPGSASPQQVAPEPGVPAPVRGAPAPAQGDTPARSPDASSGGAQAGGVCAASGARRAARQEDTPCAA